MSNSNTIDIDKAQDRIPYFEKCLESAKNHPSFIPGEMNDETFEETILLLTECIEAAHECDRYLSSLELLNNKSIS